MELSKKIHESVARQCRTRGYAAPVDVLLDIGVLTKEKYELWRFGKVAFLEQVCTANLSRLSFILKEIRHYSLEKGYKPSLTYYKCYGKKKVTGSGSKKLRFSKYGVPSVEDAYATHYVVQKKAAKPEPRKAAPEPAPVTDLTAALNDDGD